MLLVVLFFADVPARLIQLWMFLHGFPLPPTLPDANASITANAFYHLFFPWIVLAMLVILPAFSGLRQGGLLLGRNTRAVLVAAASASLLLLLIRAPGFGLLLGASAREWFWQNRIAMQVLPLLSCWPTLYLIAIGFERYRQRKAAVAQ